MSEHIGGNGVYVGSFNPPHLGHIETMRDALNSFDTLHLFVRYNEGTDLTDWPTKLGWFERIDEELGGRLTIHKMVNEAIKGKTYTTQDFIDFMRDTERIIGEPVAGFVFGGEYDGLIPTFRQSFPAKHFVEGIRPMRDGQEMSSTAIRQDLEGHRGWLPDYVYQSLHELAEKG